MNWQRPFNQLGLSLKSFFIAWLLFYNLRFRHNSMVAVHNLHSSILRSITAQPSVTQSDSNKAQSGRRSPGHLGRSRILKKLKNAEKVIVAKALDGQRYPCPA